MSAVGALGAFLTSLGGSKNERRKEEWLDAKEKEREAREEERAKRKEDREQQLEARRVAKTTVRKTGDAYREEAVNSFGDVIKVQDANPLDIEKINMDQQKDKVTIEQVLANTESARANAAQTRAETQYLPEKFGLERRLTEAQIANYNEPNHVETTTQDSKAKEEAILDQARSMIGKRVKVKVGADQPNAGSYAVKIATAEYVAEWLRQKGYAKLADQILKADDDE